MAENHSRIQRVLRSVNSASRRFVFRRTPLNPSCKHGRLVWGNKRPIEISNRPTELLAASGFLSLAKWNAHCVSCGQAILWSSSKPGKSELSANGYFRSGDAID